MCVTGYLMSLEHISAGRHPYNCDINCTGRLSEETSMHSQWLALIITVSNVMHHWLLMAKWKDIRVKHSDRGSILQWHVCCLIWLEGCFVCTFDSIHNCVMCVVSYSVCKLIMQSGTCTCDECNKCVSNFSVMCTP